MLYRLKIVTKIVRIENIDANSFPEASQIARELPNVGSTEKEVTLDKYQPDIYVALEMVIKSVDIGHFIRRIDVIDFIIHKCQVSREDVTDIIKDYFYKEQENGNWEVINKDNTVIYQKIR